MATPVTLACGDGPIQVTLDRSVVADLTGLMPLDPATEGSYEAWFIDDNGVIWSAGRFMVDQNPQSVTFPARENIRHMMVTVEPPDDNDDRPSEHKLMGGRFDQGVVALDVTGYLTVVGIPLEPVPGFHVLATPTNDQEAGFPSREDAGLWLFNPTVDTLDPGHYANFAPLTAGWRYEGWVVRDYGSSGATWISYGKFRPDAFRQANTRDDTGLGVFSGRRDYLFALGLTLHVPGDDWLTDSLGIAAAPVGLPLDLNGDSTQGVTSRWTHVITIEPWGANREAELPNEARPFFLQPYQNPIGEAAPTTPRAVVFHPDIVPSGVAVIAQ